MITLTMDGSHVTLTRGDETLSCTRDELAAMLAQLGLRSPSWQQGYATGHSDGLDAGYRQARREAEQAERKRPAIEAALRRNRSTDIYQYLPNW